MYTLHSTVALHVCGGRARIVIAIENKCARQIDEARIFKYKQNAAPWCMIIKIVILWLPLVLLDFFAFAPRAFCMRCRRRADG